MDIYILQWVLDLCLYRQWVLDLCLYGQRVLDLCLYRQWVLDLCYIGSGSKTSSTSQFLPLFIVLQIARKVQRAIRRTTKMLGNSRACSTLFLPLYFLCFLSTNFLLSISVLTIITSVLAFLVTYSETEPTSNLVTAFIPVDPIMIKSFLYSSINS